VKTDKAKEEEHEKGGPPMAEGFPRRGPDERAQLRSKTFEEWSKFFFTAREKVARRKKTDSKTLGRDLAGCAEKKREVGGNIVALGLLLGA